MVPQKTYTRDQIQSRLQNIVGQATKSVAGYSSILSQAEKSYLNKHKKELSIASKAVLARSLQGAVDRLIASSRYTMQDINSAAENLGDVNNPLSMLFTVMSIVIPNFAYADVAGLQPLPTPMSPIFFPQITANEDRNNVSKGTGLLGSNKWETTNTYSTNKYSASFALTATTTTTLTMNYPTVAFTLVPGSVTVAITVNNSTFIAQEDGEGALLPVASAGFSGGTIDYANKQIVLNFASPTQTSDTAVVTYRYNAELDPAQVILEWVTKPVHADPYRLRSSYKVDNFLAAKQTLKDYDIDQVLSTGLAGEINKEISSGVFDDMRARSDSTFTFSKQTPNGVPWSQHRFQVLQSLVESANYIRSQVKRAAGNRLVADDEMINIIETFGDDVFKRESYEVEPIGPYNEGKILGRIEVIKNQDFGSAGSTLSYKLDDLDASFLGGSFISLYASGPLTLDSLKTVQGYGSQVGFRKTFDGGISTVKIV